jgi:hypothetical protein
MNHFLEHWVFFVSFPVFIVTAVSLIAFRRISVSHIEREMLKAGAQMPSWDGLMGLRIAMYAITIARGRAHYSNFVDTKSIIKHSRRVDLFWARFFLLSSFVLIVLAACVYILDH